MRDTHLPLISAHRGGRAEAPENTVAAFRYAAELGAPARSATCISAATASRS